jgi:hypothetical protein
LLRVGHVARNRAQVPNDTVSKGDLRLLKSGYA